MNRQARPSRRAARGLKRLIGAAAVAVTLGGWAALAGASREQVALSPAPIAQPIAAPLPTLVPLLEVETPAQAHTAVAPTAAPPAALREVSAPPAARPTAVTRTRSSS